MKTPGLDICEGVLRGGILNAGLRHPELTILAYAYKRLHETVLAAHVDCTARRMDGSYRFACPTCMALHEETTSEIQPTGNLLVDPPQPFRIMGIPVIVAKGIPDSEIRMVSADGTQTIIALLRRQHD